MRIYKLIWLFILLSILSSCICSHANATKSRLSAMGDLSIVIEDESNMINLWDFTGNPAGFLDDEKGSVLRGDFVWDTFEISDLHNFGWYSSLSTFKADADILDYRVAGAYREIDNFASGIEVNYFLHKADYKYFNYEDKFTSPKMLGVFSKKLDSSTSFGIDFSYVEEKRELLDNPNDNILFIGLNRSQRIKDFKTEIGVQRRLSPEVMIGTLLGYDWFKLEKGPHMWDYYNYISDSYSFWLSGQTIVDIDHRLRLGMEVIFEFKNENFRPVMEENEKSRENYYFSYVKFRGIYDLTEKLKVGLFYFDHQLFDGFLIPTSYYVFPIPYEFTVRHFGGGCSYHIDERILVGVEYHLRDSSQPYGNEVIWGDKITSLNLGVEGKLTEGCFIRSGFVRTELRINPDYYKRRETRENTFTSGFGYQPSGGKFILEFSYRYAYKKFKEFYSDDDVTSDQNIFGLSLKKLF